MRGARAVAKAAGGYDYDLVIIGCGVGGHGAALHAVEQVRFFWFFFLSLRASSAPTTGRNELRAREKRDHTTPP